ncbi:oxidoreductase [Streptomyces sp. MUM 203J]|nr:oxidoreductase [Streptomyces sp. MUM 203J]
MADAARSAAARAAEADITGRLAPETVSLLTRAGFARHFVPRVWRGLEGTFGELLARVAAVGEGCASAAWLAALWATHGRYAAQLPPRGQRELWGDSPDVRIAAALRPAGLARRERNGWRLTGSWDCVSGVADADWLLLAAREAEHPVPPGLPGEAPRLLAVPADAVLVRDSWRCTGMRGTGSHTAQLMQPLLVPEHRTCPMTDVLAGAPGPGLARCHTTPAYLGTGLLLCAAALGAARRALEEWTHWAARVHAKARAARQDDRALHGSLTRTSDDIDAAALLLRDAAARADSGTRAERDVLRNRRQSAAAADLLVSAVERLYRTAGMHACGTPGLLERTWRDVHALAAHQALCRETASLLYANAVLAPMEPAPRTPCDGAAHRPQPLAEAVAGAR